MTRRTALVSCATAAALGAAGLLGWAVVLVLVAMIVCGLIILANHLARAVTRSMHNGKASRPACGAEGQG